MWSAQDLIRSGSRRIDGTCQEVSIFHHPWLSCNDNPFVSFWHPVLVNESVSSLLIEGSREWDVDLVQDLFNSRDTNLILGIPLSAAAVQDFWSWKGESSGHFLVKSAYKMLQDLNHNPSVDANSGFWRSL